MTKTKTRASVKKKIRSGKKKIGSGKFLSPAELEELSNATGNPGGLRRSERK